MNNISLPENAVDELLKKFVSADDIRPKFMSPWRAADKIYASETHILIRIPAHLTSTPYPQYPDDHSDKLFPEAIPNGIISLTSLSEALKEAPLIDETITVGEDIACDECNGTGEVEWDYKTWSKIFDCPVCDGSGYKDCERQEPTGRKIIYPFASIRIGQVCFKATFIKLLLETMKLCSCDYTTVTLVSSTKPALFHITDEIDVLLMPISTTPYTSIKIEENIK